MAVNGQSAWRGIGDVDLGTFCAAIPAGSPLLDEAGAIYNAVRGDSVLYLAQARMESSYATTGIATTGGHNALGNKKPGGNNENMRFASWAEGAAWWRARIRDPAGPYAGTTSIASYVHVYAPSSDGNDEARYVQVICDVGNKVSGGTTVANLTFGKPVTPTWWDQLNAKGYYNDRGTLWYRTNAKYKVINATPRYRYADAASEERVGDDVKPGDIVTAFAVGTSVSGGQWIISSYFTRFKLDDLTFIGTS